MGMGALRNYGENHLYLSWVGQNKYACILPSGTSW
jgi:hypothetical protein